MENKLQKIVLGISLIAFTYVSSMAGNLNHSKSENSNSSTMKPAGAANKPKSVVKTNLSSYALMGIGLKNISTQYELAFHKNLSFATGFSYLLESTAPKKIEFPGVSSLKLSGFSVTPEFRIYPGKKEEHQAPHGFYFAFYGRYTKFSVSAAYKDTASDIDGTVAGTYEGKGGGLMIGNQWVIGNHFSIDLFIIGGHYGKGKVGLDVEDASIGGLSEADKNDYQAEVNSKYSQYGTTKTVFSGNTAKTTIPGVPYGGIRLIGLNVGFVF